VPTSQASFQLPTREDEMGEIEREAAQNERVLRVLATVIDEEISRKHVCWALQMGESELSRRLAQADGKRPCYRMLMYALRHERTGRLAKLLMEQGGYSPPIRPVEIDDSEFRRRAEQAFRESGPAGAALRAVILGRTT
jgi:hypothetical protein